MTVFIEYDATGKILTCTDMADEFYQQAVLSGALTLVVPAFVDIFKNRVDLAVTPPALVAIPPVSPPALPPISPTFTAPQLIGLLVAAQIKALATGITVNVAAPGDPAINILCDGTADTRASLAMLALYGQINLAGTKTWIANNGQSTTLTGLELVNLATKIGGWITDTYSILAANMTLIETGVITTVEEVDAIVWTTA